MDIYVRPMKPDADPELGGCSGGVPDPLLRKFGAAFRHPRANAARRDVKRSYYISMPAEDPSQPEHDASSGLPSITPDVVEQDHGDEIDNIVPTRGYQMLPVVALGGSAGSIPALQRFFAAML